MENPGPAKTTVLTPTAALFYAALERSLGASDVDLPGLAAALELPPGKVDQQVAAAARYRGDSPPGPPSRARLLRRCLAHAREAGPETAAEEDLLERLGRFLEVSLEAAGADAVPAAPAPPAEADAPAEDLAARLAGPSWGPDAARRSGSVVNQLVSYTAIALGLFFSLASAFLGDVASLVNHLLGAVFGWQSLGPKAQRFDGGGNSLLMLLAYGYVAQVGMRLFVVLASR